MVGHGSKFGGRKEAARTQEVHSSAVRRLLALIHVDLSLSMAER
jgi:hypothetical protein